MRSAPWIRTLASAVLACAGIGVAQNTASYITTVEQQMGANAVALAVGADSECDEAAGVDERCALRLLQQRRDRLTEYCGGMLYDVTKEACCGNKTQSLSSQGCCGEQLLYSLSSQGCCGGKTLFNFTTQTCRNGVVATPGGAGSTASKFACMPNWPPEDAVGAAYWRRYCQSRGHKAWAYTLSCKQGWASRNKASVGAALAEAMRVCRWKAAKTGETCSVFDNDGSLCHKGQQQWRTDRCGENEYDITTQGCCEGKVFSKLSGGCCNSRVFDSRKEGCCGGVTYSILERSCCGSKLFHAATHGCCPTRNGFAIYPFGTHNCCRRPKGPCKIQPGQASCCT
eukprot:TRINITY_DN108815_c0_g1_i1.p1 TRINITY_DN108815_c0_g1~~TRINITY_DN108815_c0_g1_i1.p1  ORF type:complete len:349 (-),score=43.88 TRINITY_DN108815_c0_g1_i1:75-1097(-)